MGKRETQIKDEGHRVRLNVPDCGRRQQMRTLIAFAASTGKFRGLVWQRRARLWYRYSVL
jgi:hypothetical protein